VLHAFGLADVKHRDEALHVFPVVQQWVGHRLADLLLRGDVHDAVHGVLAQDVAEESAVANGADDQRHAAHPGGVAGGQVIKQTPSIPSAIITRTTWAPI